MTLACRVFGHQPAFRAEGHTMRWACERCGQAAGAKGIRLARPRRVRYAAAFNKRDADDLGKRAPLIGLLPLRIWRRLRRP